MARVRLLMVFNPQAAFGRARRLLQPLLDALGHFARVDVLQTGAAGDAVTQVAAARLSDYDGLLAAGGDGTLFEVLNGLYRHAPDRRVPLGLLPVGTGNAFARDLGLAPGDWQKAVAQIGAARLRRVDVGRVEPAGGVVEDVAEDVADWRPFHFLNIIGAGLPADAMRTAERIKFVGNSAYSLAAFWRAMVLRTYPLLIELDGETIGQDALFVEISNTRYTGTSFLMAPAARLDDGLLDITVVRRLSRLRLLRLFSTIYSGRHVEHAEVLTRQARSVRIIGPPGLQLAPDGEFRGQVPARVTCLPRDLEIFG
jgi:diacylglycerol kinase (ATP)